MSNGVQVTDTAVRNYPTHVIARALSLSLSPSTGINRDTILSGFAMRVPANNVCRGSLQETIPNQFVRVFVLYSIDFSILDRIPYDLRMIDILRMRCKSRKCISTRDFLVTADSPPLRAFLGVCRCCDNGVTCRFALLLFVEERREREKRPFVGKANANRIK